MSPSFLGRRHGHEAREVGGGAAQGTFEAVAPLYGPATPRYGASAVVSGSNGGGIGHCQSILPLFD